MPDENIWMKFLELETAFIWMFFINPLRKLLRWSSVYVQPLAFCKLWSGETFMFGLTCSQAHPFHCNIIVGLEAINEDLSLKPDLEPAIKPRKSLCKFSLESRLLHSLFFHLLFFSSLSTEVAKDVWCYKFIPFTDFTGYKVSGWFFLLTVELISLIQTPIPGFLLIL